MLQRALRFLVRCVTNPYKVFSAPQPPQDVLWCSTWRVIPTLHIVHFGLWSVCHPHAARWAPQSGSRHSPVLLTESRLSICNLAHPANKIYLRFAPGTAHFPVPHGGCRRLAELGQCVPSITVVPVALSFLGYHRCLILFNLAFDPVWYQYI
ncbi:hypothetical protein FRC08_013769 [Ceratobasidium sp. 394]|nr:hypothetical protein FRC08_013769 [Ceratobasidium sp. 394]